MTLVTEPPEVDPPRRPTTACPDRAPPGMGRAAVGPLPRPRPRAGGGGRRRGHRRLLLGRRGRRHHPGPVPGRGRRVDRGAPRPRGRPRAHDLYPLELSARGTRGEAPFAKHPLYALVLAGAEQGRRDRRPWSPCPCSARWPRPPWPPPSPPASADPAWPGPPCGPSGLGSPLFFDGNLVIAHTLGAARSAAAVLVALRALDHGRRAAALALLVAPLVAVAVLFRTEALLFGLALAVAAGIVALRRRPLRTTAALVAVASLAGAGLAAVRRDPVGGRHRRRTADHRPPAGPGDTAGLVAGRIHAFVLTWLRPTLRRRRGRHRPGGDGGRPRPGRLRRPPPPGRRRARCACSPPWPRSRRSLAAGRRAPAPSSPDCWSPARSLLAGLLWRVRRDRRSPLAPMRRSAVGHVRRLRPGRARHPVLHRRVGGVGRPVLRHRACRSPSRWPRRPPRRRPAACPRRRPPGGRRRPRRLLRQPGGHGRRRAPRHPPVHRRPGGGRRPAPRVHLGDRPVILTTEPAMPRSAWATFDRQRWLLTRSDDLSGVVGRLRAAASTASPWCPAGRRADLARQLGPGVPWSTADPGPRASAGGCLVLDTPVAKLGIARRYPRTGV